MQRNVRADEVDTHRANYPKFPLRSVGGFTQRGQKRWCSYAKAVAAARDDTPSLVKMLLTCRSTVRSLRTKSAAIALLVRPAVTSRRTCSSRCVSPWVSPDLALRSGEPTRASAALRS